MKSYSLRTLLLFVLIIALIFGWTIDHNRLTHDLDIQRRRSVFSTKDYEQRLDGIEDLAASPQERDAHLFLFALSDPDPRIARIALQALQRIPYTTHSDDPAIVTELRRRLGGSVIRSSLGDLNVIPPWERWQITFSTGSIGEFAKQLDYFDIEIGAMDRNSPKIEYASKVSTGSPTVRQGTRVQERRFYVVLPKQGVTTDFTRRLLARASISTTDAESMREQYLTLFFADETFEKLAALEQRSLESLRETEFEVRSIDERRFHVVVVRHEFD